MSYTSKNMAENNIGCTCLKIKFAVKVFEGNIRNS